MNKSPSNRPFDISTFGRLPLVKDPITIKKSTNILSEPHIKVLTKEKQSSNLLESTKDKPATDVIVTKQEKNTYLFWPPHNEITWHTVSHATDGTLQLPKFNFMKKFIGKEDKIKYGGTIKQPGGHVQKMNI